MGGNQVASAEAERGTGRRFGASFEASFHVDGAAPRVPPKRNCCLGPCFQSKESLAGGGSSENCAAAFVWRALPLRGSPLGKKEEGGDDFANRPLLVSGGKEEDKEEPVEPR